MKQLAYEVYQIMHPELRDCVIAALEAAPEYFWTAPASRNHHPPDERVTGGIIKHVKRAFVLGKQLCRAHGIVGFRRELILSAILVHDVCVQGEEDKGVGYTVGDHELLLRKYYIDYGVAQLVDNTYWTRILELVETHSGRWGEKRPENQMQYIVHIADYISSRSNVIVLLDKEEEVND